ncbi:MAG: sugar transferase [Enterococcus lacertideformus]|uniref:Sugar transferase n=1 Tax=Enterococcus lacertideformus TaxID=2771493 RepID=A0A931AYQ1_9ENTE|nr:sugar transferase [Enterococcus lacertideformus]
MSALLLSSILLIVLSIPMVIISSILFVINDRKILFKQKRVGRNEKIFTIYKFKTMTDAVDESGALLPDEHRLTPFGTFLRKLSLDELPQLFNILKGEMCFIGPRPLLVDYLPLYTDEQRKRHQVYPGMTGLAQVSGRNSLDWNDKFRLDVQYVNKMNVRMDIKIIWSTLSMVIKQKHIGQDGEITIKRFTGHSDVSGGIK